MKATLLTVKKTFGKRMLEIIKRNGAKAKASDFAIATGVWIDDEGYAPYYLKDPNDGFARAVDDNGSKYFYTTNYRTVGVRPAIKFESIDEIYENGGEILENNKLKFGTYADNALLKNEQKEWTKLEESGKLEKCGEYELDLTRYINYGIPYTPTRVPIYEYNGKKAIKIKVNSSLDGRLFELSNGQWYEDKDYVWFEVKDFIWEFDEENLMAISEKVILGGIKFDNEFNKYYDKKDFPKTNMGKYLNEVFLPNLLQFNKPKLHNSNKEKVLVELRKQGRQLKKLRKENAEYRKAIEELDKKLNEIGEILALKPYK